jgi:hypothetical protein
MDAAGENHIVARADQLTHSAVSRQRRGHREEKLHVTGSGFCQHIVHVFVQRLIIQAIQMAVGVD